MSYRHRRSPLSLLLILISLMSCLGCSRAEPGSERPATIREPQSFTGEKVEVNHAEGFRVHYREHYKLLEILNPWQDRTDTLRYVLVPRGDRAPPPGIDAEVIEVPIRSLIATSTTHLGLTGMLEANHIVAGITQPDYVYSPSIREGLESGYIAAFDGSEFNRELALKIDPDLIMISGGQSSRFDSFHVLRESGIAVMVNSEWLETSALGKAEWVKMLGVLLNKEELANQAFKRVEKRYRELQATADTVTSEPLVINNTPYKGAWFVSGGNSFLASYLKDAGAGYAWYDQPSPGGLRLEFEAVYEVGLRADIWINPGAARSMQELLAMDSRFSDFKSVETRNVFNNNRRLGPTGGNDYWETGVVRPDIVLADLIQIFHPSLLSDRELYFYQRLELWRRSAFDIPPGTSAR